MSSVGVPSVAELMARLEAEVSAAEVDPDRVGNLLDQVRALPASAQREVPEHEYAQLLLLLDLCLLISGRRETTPWLVSACDRYARTSLRYTGRIIPRTRSLIEMLGRPVTTRSAEYLVEAADQTSQGWAGYSDSPFPRAFGRLAEVFGAHVDPDDLRSTSYVCWRQGLAAARRGDAIGAVRAFGRSLARYRRFAYFADAAWLHVDLVIAYLLAGQPDQAEAVAAAQRDYVEELIAAFGTAGPEETPRDGIGLGDVQSGPYTTFVESLSVGPTRLSVRDQALLRRYTRVAARLVAFGRGAGVGQLDEAVDLFTFGWVGYPESPYPVIFRRLAGQVLGEPHTVNPYRTVHARWRGALASARLPVTAPYLVTLIDEVRARLERIGLVSEAAMSILDAAMLCLSRGDDATAVALLAGHEERLRRHAPAPTRTVVAGMAATRPENLDGVLAEYLARRAGYTVPSFIPALSAFGGVVDRGPRMELEILGEALLVNGVVVYERCPPAVVDILAALHEAAVGDPDDWPLSTAALARQTGRTPAALAQTIRRFRTVCGARLRAATGRKFDREAVIQGRPGYRLNPDQVVSVRVHREPIAADPETSRLVPVQYATMDGRDRVTEESA